MVPRPLHPRRAHDRDNDQSGLFFGAAASVAERGRALVGIKRAEPLGVETLLSLSVKLLRGRGEASGAATARAILDGYGALGPAERRAWLEGAAARFGPDLAALAAAARAFLEAPDDAKAADISDRAEPTRQELIRRLNHAPGGTLALVRMREDILDAIAEDVPLQAVDRDFRHLFASWFNRGFLVLRRIDWTTPANILEKIIRYEAVHEIAAGKISAAGWSRQIAGSMRSFIPRSTTSL